MYKAQHEPKKIKLDGSTYANQNIKRGDVFIKLKQKNAEYVN